MFRGKKGFIEKGEGRFPHLYVTSALEVEKMAVKFKLALIIFVNVGFIVSTEGRSLKEDSLDLEAHDVSVMMEKRGSKVCINRNEEYKPGTTVNIAVAPKYDRCDKCKCIKGKFRKCTKLYSCHVADQCKVEDYVWQPGSCCPECKQKDCSDDREVGERWERLVRLPGGKKKGICSLCECRADGKEFCEDNLLLCFKPEGCLETEMKPDHCCPQCKTRATAMTTAQPTFMIVEGTEESSLPFPFGFDANTEQD